MPHLRFLGPSPALWAADAPPGSPETAPPQPLAAVDAALLARLAIDGACERHTLAAWLWPAADAAGAATNLRQRIYRLKRLAPTLLQDSGAHLALAAGTTSDIQDFEQRLQQDAQYGAGDLLPTPQVALQFADNEAVRQWLAAQQQHLADTKQRLLLAHVDRLRELRQLPAAVQVAQRLVQELPLSEAAWRCLMSLHHQMGETAQAQAAYERCRATLQQALQVQPSAETQALAKMLAPPLNRGETLLRPGPAQPPLPAQTEAARSALPAALLRPPVLVQRQAQWQQAQAALRQGQAVLLLGAAGVGKSRLLGDLAQQWGPACVVNGGAGDGVVPYAYLALLLDLASRRFGWPMAENVRSELTGLLCASPEGLAEGCDRRRNGQGSS